ncbi:MAG: hypothetical protein AUI14_24905 [Actinobacteria bacterium 13_2_20CM_2_71_6]|nr:MAG: hypothetical protein AUI14_24905 [Actinobacteria bacterium 13_2_20CM_2_71_6]
MRSRRWLAAAVCASLAVQIGVFAGFPLPLLAMRPASAANPPAPVAPPAAVNPTPSVQVVTSPGPTQVGQGSITQDTVWGPQGSPYVVKSLTVTNRASLTLLPGTVVKLDAAAVITVMTGSQILALGTPGAHVVTDVAFG